MGEIFKPTEEPSRIITNEEVRLSLADRYTKIRNRKIEASECGADFVVDTSLGIRVLTDSKKLAKEVESSMRKNNSSFKSPIEFIYLTKRDVGIVGEGETLPKPISLGVLGDLVVDETLTQYALAGPDKFGSLESVLFGIYSFERAKEGYLGLHGAQIYDNKKHVSHVITGGSSIGKSTIAQFLEKSLPGRFSVLADDWVEIDPSQKNVRPISTTFGSRSGTLTDEIVNSNRRIEDKFTSFGKNFYTPGGIKKTDELIGSIILLLDPKHDFSEKGAADYFIDSNHHIPFMSQFHTETKSLPISVTSRLDGMLYNFSKLCKNKHFSVVKLANRDIGQNTSEVLKMIG